MRENPAVIALIGATGRLGGHILQAALARGYRLQALARKPEALLPAAPGLQVFPGDVRDPEAVTACVAGADVIVSALGTRRGQEPYTVLAEGMATLVAAAQRCGVPRILAVASAGLLDAPEGGLRRDAAGYPAVFRASSAQHLAASETLKASGLFWTLFCPPELVEGDSAQPLQVVVDVLPAGPKRVSMPALAALILDEVTHPRYTGQRVGMNNAEATAWRACRLAGALAAGDVGVPWTPRWALTQQSPG
jgi:putative NADH-flavin reductase